MRILVVEDDPLQSDSLLKVLKRSFANVRFDPILKSEAAFCFAIDQIFSDPPDIILIDVMLRWTEKRGSDAPVPPALVDEEGYYRAGIRCQRLAAEFEKKTGKTIPIVLLTILDAGTLRKDTSALPPHVAHVKKEADPIELIAKIRELVTGNSSTVPVY